MDPLVQQLGTEPHYPELTIFLSCLLKDQGSAPGPVIIWRRDYAGIGFTLWVQERGFSTILSFIEPQDNSGWKKPQEVSSPTTCSKPGESWGLIRLLRFIPSPRMQTAQSQCTPSSSAWLSSLWKYFSLHPFKTTLASICAHCVSSSHHALLQKAKLHLLGILLEGCSLHIGKDFLRTDQPILFPNSAARKITGLPGH